jgi:hypothetical protein
MQALMAALAMVEGQTRNDTASAGLADVLASGDASSRSQKFSEPVEMFERARR